MGHYLNTFFFEELDDDTICEIISGVCKGFTGEDYHLDRQGFVITNPPERWRFAVQIKAKPKHRAVLDIGRAKSFSANGKATSGQFSRSTATVAQIEVGVGSKPEAATVRAALWDSVIPGGRGLLHKVYIDLDGTPTVTPNPRWVQGLAEEEANNAMAAEPKPKAVGARKKANNPAYKKENKKN